MPVGILEELLGGPGHGSSLRGDRRRFHSWPRTGCLFERAPDSRGASLSDSVQAVGGEFGQGQRGGSPLGGDKQGIIRFGETGAGSGGGVAETVSGKNVVCR